MSKIEKRYVEIGFRPDGSPIRIPFIKIGSGDKKLFIAAVVHGDEVTGLVSIWKLLKYIDKTSVHGEIGIVPVINIEGFNYCVRGIPLATVDLNRLYPGDPKGSLAERITATIWKLAKGYEFIVDMHTAGLSIPFILIDPAPLELRKKIIDVAVKTGITVLDEYAPEKYELKKLAASLPGVAIKENIPSFTVELPGVIGPDEKGVSVGFKVLKNIVITLGLIEDSYEEVNEYPVIKELGYRREDVTALHGGFIEYNVTLGEKVKENTRIAIIRNVFGEIVEEVKAPKECYIVALHDSRRIWSGSTAALIAVKYTPR